MLPGGGENERLVRPVSIFRIEPANLLLVNMKPVKGEKAVLLQMREIAGKPARFAVQSDGVSFDRITVCDVVGDPLPGAPVPDFAPWENKFVKLTWK